MNSLRALAPRSRRRRAVLHPAANRIALSAAFVTIAVAISALAAQAEVTQSETVRVAFNGKLTPHSLPRDRPAPVRVAVGATISPVLAGAVPPPLRQITIEINRHGVLDPTGLPLCRYHDVQPATTQRALEACRSALVGRGSFASTVLQASEAPFPAKGELYAFNGIYRGKPAILAHIYGATPIPVSYTIPFTISKATGNYGTKLTAPMPSLSSEWGYITGLSLNLGRSFTYRGRRHSYISGTCPTPEDVPTASFPFSRATFAFDGTTLSSALIRTCRGHG